MNQMIKPVIEWADFEKIDIRSGRIIEAERFPEARKPAFKLCIDFGVLGIKKSSAQITDLYTPQQLIGHQILAVVNFPPKRIGTFISECLVLGIYKETGEVVLAVAEQNVSNGSIIG